MTQLDFSKKLYDWSKIDTTKTGTATVHLPKNWRDQTDPHITDPMHAVDGEQIRIGYGDNTKGEFRWYGGNMRAGGYWWWHPDWLVNVTLPMPPVIQEED